MTDEVNKQHIKFLEERIINFEALLRDHMQNDTIQHAKLEQGLTNILRIIGSYKGFIGGILFVFSCVGAVVALVIQYLGKG